MAGHIDIPLAYRLGKRRYKVVEVHSIKSARGVSLMGQANFENYTVTIATHNARTKRKYNKGEIANSFLHEMVHTILFDMNHRLNNDERFVCDFSDRLQEALESFRY